MQIFQDFTLNTIYIKRKNAIKLSNDESGILLLFLELLVISLEPKNVKKIRFAITNFIFYRSFLIH